MKLSKDTLAILKNFASINQSIQFEEGKTLRTISPTKAVAAIMDIEEEIEGTAAVYDLSRFLAVVQTYKDPEITFGEGAFSIYEGKRRTPYEYVDPSMIIVPKKKSVDFPKADVIVEVKAEDFEDVLKMAGILGLPDIAFIGDGEKCVLRAMDAEEASKNSHSVEVGETSETFRAVITAANLKLIPQSYKVELSKRGISKFEGENGIVYYVAVSAKYSEFE